MKYGLISIVKNEEVCIERMLDSVYACGIDTWVIVDTGSTDNTKKLIEEKAADLGGIHLHLVNDPWQNFATNRNLAIREAFIWSDYSIDYWVLLDADEVLSNPGGAPSVQDGHGLYQLYEVMRNEEPQIGFWAPRLLKNGAPFRYKGRAHEVLVSPEPATVSQVEEWRIDHLDGGNFSRQGMRAKFKRNFMLLLKDLHDPEADHTRTLFYLAMTLECMGSPRDLKQAARYYQERVDAGGWEEEAWYALYRKGICEVQLDRITGVDTLLRAYARRPWRCEPLVDLGTWYHERGNDQLAQMFIPRAFFPFPRGDVLFVREGLYQAKADAASLPGIAWSN